MKRSCGGNSLPIGTEDFDREDVDCLWLMTTSGKDQLSLCSCFRRIGKLCSEWGAQFCKNVKTCNKAWSFLFTEQSLSFLFMVLLWAYLSRANLSDFHAFGVFLLPPLCPKPQVYLFSHQIIWGHLFYSRHYAQHGIYGEHAYRALNHHQGIDYQISSCMFFSLDNSLWPLCPSLTK